MASRTDNLEASITGKEAGAQNDKRKFGDRGSTGSEPDTPVFKKAILDLVDSNDSPDTHGTISKQAAVNFSDMLIKTFQQKSFLNTFVPILATVMTPIIQASVDAALVGLRDTEAIDKLRKTVYEQSKVIDEQKIQIDRNKKKITELQHDSKGLSDTNIKLVKEVQMLFVENENMQFQLDNYEQYRWRNSIRINNLKLHPSVTTEDEMTEIVTDFINGHVLIADPGDSNEEALGFDSTARPKMKLDPISPNDIERCHFVGRSKQQILVKFSRYHDKRRVYMNKKKLKNNPRKIFITEDLTKMNHRLVKILMEEQYERKSIYGFWTRDGNIFVKGREGDYPTRVKTRADITKLLCKLNNPAPTDTTAEPSSMDPV